MSIIKEIARYMLHLIAPVICVGCGRAGTLLCHICTENLYDYWEYCIFCRTPSGNGICRTCSSRRHISRIIWKTAYTQPLARSLVTQLKYRGVFTLTPAIAELMARRITQENIPQTHADTLLLPVPLYPKKERFRGFNQSQLLAEEITRRICLQTLPKGTLTRVRNTPSQARTVDKKIRKQQLAGAFAIQHPEHIKGKHVLLIDDVATTGATLGAAAQVLARAGAADISAVIFARG